MDDIASSITSILHHCPKEERAFSGFFVEKEKVQKRGLGRLKLKEVGWPLPESRTSAVVLDLVQSSGSGTFEAASGVSLETAGSAPPIPGGSEDYELHTRGEVFL